MVWLYKQIKSPCKRDNDCSNHRQNLNSPLWECWSSWRRVCEDQIISVPSLWSLSSQHLVAHQLQHHVVWGQPDCLRSWSVSSSSRYVRSLTQTVVWHLLRDKALVVVCTMYFRDIHTVTMAHWDERVYTGHWSGDYWPQIKFPTWYWMYCGTTRGWYSPTMKTKHDFQNFGLVSPEFWKKNVWHNMV